MKNQFKVVSWTQDVSKYTESEILINPQGEELVIDPLPLEGTTTFKIELSTVDINNVNQVVGTTYITLDRLTAYSEDARFEIERKLADRGLLEMRKLNDLEQAKYLRWGRLVAIRDGLELKGFNYLGKTFDSDIRSILRLVGIIQAAMVAKMTGKDFSVDWITADNSIITMTCDEVLGLTDAMAENINAIHTQAQHLKAKLDATSSILEVNEIMWPGVEY